MGNNITSKYVLVVWLICFFYCPLSAIPGEIYPFDFERCMKYIDIAFEELANYYKIFYQISKLNSCNKTAGVPAILLSINADILDISSRVTQCDLTIIDSLIKPAANIEVNCGGTEKAFKLPRLIVQQTYLPPEDEDEDEDDYADIDVNSPYG